MACGCGAACNEGGKLPSDGRKRKKALKINDSTFRRDCISARKSDNVWGYSSVQREIVCFVLLSRTRPTAVFPGAAV